MKPVLTVGLDGSPESLAAARWGAATADRQGLTLRLLHAWLPLAPGPRTGSAESDQHHWAQRILHDAHVELHKRYPVLSIVADLVADDGRSALLTAAAKSRMIVLGSRGLAAAGSYFLGNISMDVVSRAEQPVVLVRASLEEMAPSPVGNCVVVGLSLRDPCDELFEFAFSAAAARGVPLRAVHGHEVPVQAHMPWGVDPEVAAEITDKAQKKLRKQLRPWRKKFRGVRVVKVLTLDSPAKVVVHDTQTAGLLVVGRRRHRGALAPRLGPVAQAAVHHAACPIAVVPHG
ncbi:MULTISPECIES: universal stress protein [Streptomyces]|uniref:universal stress protein n=1 Tax=Streptomyces TaxID=1883 RepID=UPI0004C08744|nr:MULTISPECIES: universal stress protein [Streptomyces]MDX3275839.1 universal stress protein [Streptomyces scabiei]MDX3847076.1 universal stress protein [Streptomyces europaeiscabiei]